jgi:iron(III) transport system permease protein
MSTSSIKTKSSIGVGQLILFLSVAILVIVVAFPVLLILFNAFWVEGHFNLKNVVEVLSEPDTFKALKNSLIIASCTTIGSTIVGTFFAWLVTRTDLPHKTFMKSMFLVPFMLPSLHRGAGLEDAALTARRLHQPFFHGHLGFTARSSTSTVLCRVSLLVETMYLFPFVFIQVCGALGTHGSDAGGIGADFRRGSVHHHAQDHHPAGAAQSILSGALLIMLYSMAHFGTVAVLGIETGIYNIPTADLRKDPPERGSFDSIRTATVLATVLVITAALILWLQNRVLAKGKYQIIAGKSFRPTEFKLRGLRIPMLFLCIAYIALTIVCPR